MEHAVGQKSYQTERENKDKLHKIRFRIRSKTGHSAQERVKCQKSEKEFVLVRNTKGIYNVK